MIRDNWRVGMVPIRDGVANMYEPGGLQNIFHQIHVWLVEIIALLSLIVGATRPLIREVRNMFPRKRKQRDTENSVDRVA